MRAGGYLRRRVHNWKTSLTNVDNRGQLMALHPFKNELCMVVAINDVHGP
jgi:hypothetical protein